MLSISHLTKKYGETVAVDDLSLEINAGEIYGFIGHNGAGKTTTIKAVVGILGFDAGEITVNGISVKADPIACKKMIAYIPDNPDLYDFMTGIKYLNFIADIFGVGEAERKERIRKYADIFDLTDAIALGHDLGHTPFGHVGEKVLNRIHPDGFVHNEQSLRTVDVIEDTSRRRGLNLTYEVRDGILNHRGNVTPMTLEGQIVRICDRIAYVNHDIDDAIRSGVITFDQLPEREIEILGSTHSDRINNLIVDLCKNSEGKDTVSLSPEFAGSLDRLRTFMFRNVYNSSEVRGVSDLDKVERIISSLYKYYMEHSDEIPGIYKKIEEEEGTATAVKDLISGMTDRYALNLYDKLFVPQGWRQL